MAEGTPIKEKKEKKEKKDKKRKSEAADVTMDTETPVKPEVVPPAEGTASAEAVAMEVDGEKAAKKAKKEKRKSVGGDVAAEEQDAKVSSLSVVEVMGVRGWVLRKRHMVPDHWNTARSSPLPWSSTRRVCR
jgi:hypothetical protein